MEQAYIERAAAASQQAFDRFQAMISESPSEMEVLAAVKLLVDLNKVFSNEAKSPGAKPAVELAQQISAGIRGR